MEDINCWQSKYQSCEYSDRLMNKLYQMNQEVNSPIDLEEVRKGIYYAKKYHGSQMRQSGEPYYSHPIAVADMVAEYTALEKPQFFRTDMIVTALLHDTIEDTELTEEMIAEIFDAKVASQVEDLTRVKPYGKISSGEIMEILYFQNKTSSLIIKILDRYHNIQTVGIKPPAKVQKIVYETLKSFLVVCIYLESTKLENCMYKLCCDAMDNAIQQLQ